MSIKNMESNKMHCPVCKEEKWPNQIKNNVSMETAFANPAKPEAHIIPPTLICKDCGGVLEPVGKKLKDNI